MNINNDLKIYIETEILPEYKLNDKGHDLLHVNNVLNRAFEIAEKYEVDDVKLFVEKCKTLNKNAYLDTPNFALKKDVEHFKKIIEKTGVGVVANNYYALMLGENVVIGAGLNVYNSFTAFELKKPFFTAESDMAKRIDFAYMTFRHCPMKNLLNASCEKWPYEEGFTYQMDSGKVMKLKRKKLASCTFYLTD